MKISTKGRYALRMLLDLAEHQSEGYIALKDIAARGAREGLGSRYRQPTRWQSPGRGRR